MAINDDLRDFLRTSRARVRPGDVGLPEQRRAGTGPAGGRRVPGLRREEVAALAGVSPDYYARLEQGRTHQVGRPVLEAVATALCLGEVEREYLLALVDTQNGPRQRTRGPRPVVHPGALRLLDSFNHAAAFVLGRGMFLLAMNATAKALLFDPDEHPAARHNLALWRFLDPDARQRYAGWEAVAYDTAATLRKDAVEDPDEPELRAVLRELDAKSEDFARMWREHRVYECSYGTKDLVHPLVGELHLDYIALDVPRAPGQRLHVYTAAPGSLSEDRLRHLSAWAHSDGTVAHLATDPQPDRGEVHGHRGPLPPPQAPSC